MTEPTDRPTEPTDRPASRPTEADRPTDRPTDLTDRPTDRPHGWMDGWMDRWMDEWINGWMNKLMNKWMNVTVTQKFNEWELTARKWNLVGRREVVSSWQPVCRSRPSYPTATCRRQPRRDWRFPWRGWFPPTSPDSHDLHIIHEVIYTWSTRDLHTSCIRHAHYLHDLYAVVSTWDKHDLWASAVPVRM